MNLPITFPVVVITDFSPSDPETKVVDYFVSEKWFTTASGRDIENGARRDMLLFDSAGRAWKVADCRKVKIQKSFWNFLPGMRFYDVEYDLLDLGSYALNDLKEQLYEAIQSYPDIWVDDELVAGEAGGPRNEQELLDEAKAKVRKASTLREILVEALEVKPSLLPPS